MQVEGAGGAATSAAMGSDDSYGAAIARSGSLNGEGSVGSSSPKASNPTSIFSMVKVRTELRTLDNGVENS